jgi:hypothetical protein
MVEQPRPQYNQRHRHELAQEDAGAHRPAAYVEAQVHLREALRRRHRQAVDVRVDKAHRDEGQQMQPRLVIRCVKLAAWWDVCQEELWRHAVVREHEIRPARREERASHAIFSLTCEPGRAVRQ